MSGRIMTFVAILVAGVVAGFGLSYLLQPESDLPGATSGNPGEKRILYWVAPMDPNFRRDAPGKSPMGMDLIPVYEDGEAAGGVVEVDPAVVSNIGVRTATVERTMLGAPIQTVGRITYDEERVARVHLRTSGWIERLAVRAEGEPVEKGDLLFRVYSPDLVNAQAEFVQAVKSGRASVVNASRDRLVAMGISGNQIGALEKSRTPAQYVRVYAPISGVVTMLGVADGMYVKPETQVMGLADLSQVWLISDVFEADMERVRRGAPVEARSGYAPGTVLRGKVDYVYPDLDPVTRTVPVRTSLPNPGGVLRPGMFMTVRLGAEAPSEVAAIPREALIRTGRDERVILALGGGRFRPAQVSSGLEGDGKVEILSGLAVGEQVVTSGQFLIDSESSFAGAVMRMAPDAGERPLPDAPIPQSGGMDMEVGMNKPAGDSMPGGAEKPDRHAGIGLVNAVQLDTRKLNMSHDPIASLGWPSMTMDFAVADGVDLSVVSESDRIRFVLEEGEGGGYVLREIEVLP